MATTIRKTTFNCNQNSTIPHQKADLVDRMEGNPGKGIPPADRVFVQECVDIDLHALAASIPGWGAIQERHGTSDGHANTGILYRISAGVPSKTEVVPIGDAPDTRARFLTGGLFPDGWDWSAHVFPSRDSEFIPAEVAAIGAWVKAHGGQHTGGLDRNQCKVVALEHATGLDWHAPKGATDPTGGILTNHLVTAATELPEGFSDHPGDTFVLSLPGKHQGGKPVTPTPPAGGAIARILASLRRALKRFRVTGKRGKARRAKAAIDALEPQPKTPPKPAPKPDPKPAPKPTAHGFMPGAVLELVPFGSSDPPIVPVAVSQHIAVSNATSLQHLFENDGGIESHFYVLKDGTIKQHRSIFIQADAQFDSNHPGMGVVSVEHQGGVGSDLNVPMPKAQLDAFHRVILFVASQAPGFRFQVCPAYDKPGVGYHAMFPEWNLNHHSCPGAARIKQFHDVTVPWLKTAGK